MVDSILETIDNEAKLGELSAVNPAIDRLIKAYLDYTAVATTDLPYLTEDSTGAELKAAIISLEPKLKLKLISKYNSDREEMLKQTYPTNTEEKTNVADTPIERIWEDTVLRRWIVKFVLIASFSMVLLVTGAAIALGLLTGAFTDGVFFSAILNTATELIKIIFGVS